MKKTHRHRTNPEITFTYILSNKRQTLVAALGVTFGIAVFIFMNSLMTGFDRNATESLFKATPHIRIFSEAALSKPLIDSGATVPVIVNPKIENTRGNIVDPYRQMEILKRQPDVVAVAPEVSLNVFFNNGGTRLTGMTSGVRIEDEDAMFNISSFIVEGNIRDLNATLNGIVIGTGIAEKLNIHQNDNITLTSVAGVTKVMKVVALYKSGNTQVDKSRSYVNLSVAQQLLRESPSYITDIYVNIRDYKKSQEAMRRFSKLTGYKAEDWQVSNADALAANKVRRAMALAISSCIMLVAGFGIYNILNMTVSQKLNEIAILKAMGFTGSDVIRIFVLQSLVIGFIGVLIGLGFATILVRIMSRVYVGGSIGFFPIGFEPFYYFAGTLFGLFVTFAAGFFPARKASKLDPVSIFRK